MNRSTRFAQRLLLSAGVLLPALGLTQTSAPEVSWLAAGLSTNNLSAEYSPNGSYVLFQTSSGQYQLWRPTTQTMVWSLNTTTPGAQFSADSKYVLIPASTGVMRVDAATGAVVDTLAAPGLAGTPVTVSQHGNFVAIGTATKAFVYIYPSMTAAANYDHTAGTPYPFVLSGAGNDPVLIVGNDATAGTGGARIFDANSGTLLGTSQGFTSAIYRTTGNPQVLGMSGGLTNGNKRLYATNAKPYSTGELANFFSGATSGFTANNFAFPASVERTGTYVGIPTRNNAQTQQHMYWVNRATGDVQATSTLGITFGSTSGGAAVRFAPNTSAFVLYGTNGGTNAFAYYYTYNPATLAVSTPVPLIGGNVSSVLDGHLPSSAIAHGTLNGVPVTVDATKATNSAVSLYARNSATGGSTFAHNLGRPGPQTGFNGIAVSPDSSRVAIATDTNVRLYNLTTGALLATSSNMAVEGVAFLNNDEVYTGLTKLKYNGSGFFPTFASVQALSPTNSPSGALVMGRDTANPNTLIITNLAGTTSTRTFTTSPSAYGFIGESAVWVSYSTTTATAVNVVTEFYSTSWGTATGQVNRTATFTRTGGSTETMGSRVGPDGKWIAAWYTGNFAPGAQGGNGNSIPTLGSLRIMSGKTGSIRATDYFAPISGSGVTAASFAADGLHFEYSTTEGTLVSTYIPAWVQSLAFAVSPIRGGNNASAVVTLTHAVDDPVTIPFTLTSHFDVAGSSFVVAAGTSTRTATVTTKGVASQSTGQLSLTWKGETRTANVTLQPAAILSVSVSPNTVVGGTGSTMTVNLDGKAPPVDGLSVALSTNNAFASLPATLLIAPGAKTGTAPVTTVGVPAQKTTLLTAAANSTSKTISIKINPPTLQTFTLDTNGTVGGNLVRGTITLDGPVPEGGLALTLTSSNTAAIPSMTVNLPAGVSTYSFNIGTNPTVATVSNITLSAKVLTTTKVATVTVVRPDLVHFSLNKMRVVGGEQIRATIALDGDAPAGLAVNVTFSNANASIAAPFSFTTGDSSMTFLIDTAIVTSTQTVDIEVDCGGVKIKITGVTILPA